MRTAHSGSRTINLQIAEHDADSVAEGKAGIDLHTNTTGGDVRSGFLVVTLGLSSNNF
jgi:hypothetical protein